MGSEEARLKRVFELHSLAVPSSEAAFRAFDLDRLIEVERVSLAGRLHCTETGTSCAVVGRRQRRGTGRQRETPKDRTRRVRIGVLQTCPLTPFLPASHTTELGVMFTFRLAFGRTSPACTHQ